MTSPDELADIRERVRARYAGAAAAEDHLAAADRIERGRQFGAFVGALSFAEYRDGLAAAGFTGISIAPTHQVADSLHSAIVRAARP